MFEERQSGGDTAGWDGADWDGADWDGAGWDAPLPSPDGPERSEDGYRAEVDWLIGHDPQNRPGPSAAQLIGRGEAEPVTPALIAALQTVDPATVDEDLRVGLSRAWDRAANYCHGQRALAAAAVVVASPDGVEVPRELHAAGQLGAALGLGRVAADELVTAATALPRLPAARAMTLAGDLTWRKAASLATATLALTSDQARRVEQAVLPAAAHQPAGRFDAAVRRAVDQVDPDGADARRRQQRRDIRMARHHYGDGRAQIFLDLPSEHADRIWLAADTWARRRKAAGDRRSLQELRVNAWLSWADSFLSHGDPHTCDNDGHHPPVTDEASADDEPDDTAPAADTAPAVVPASADGEPVVAPGSGSSAPRRHGRPVVQTLVWDLTSLLGLTRHCGLLLDSTTILAPATLAGMITAGVRVRRAVLDGDGHLIDLTARSWLLAGTDGASHRSPVDLLLTTTGRHADLPADQQQALHDLEHTDPALAAVLRELLDHPLTAHNLDGRPGDDHASAALAAYMCLRAGHPVNPAAGTSPANAADLDHHQPHADGGATIRTNLGPLTRRWHRLKTFDGWTVQQTPDGWQWTSPTGRHYLIEPFDYRLGP
jgi:hypothetical protein